MTIGQAMITAIFTVAGSLTATWITAIYASRTIKKSSAMAYGALTQRVDEHGRRLDDLDEDKNRQWDRIIGAELRLENLRGRHKLNGGHE